jgi:hypothetical protein
MKILIINTDNQLQWKEIKSKSIKIWQEIETHIHKDPEFFRYIISDVKTGCRIYTGQYGQPQYKVIQDAKQKINIAKILEGQKEFIENNQDFFKTKEA